MTIAQLQTTWTGLNGLPGYTFFYVDATAAGLAPVPFFWDSIKQFFPTPMTWTVQGVWKLIDETNGKMTGVGGSGPNSTIAATGSAAYVAQAGCQIKWGTNNFERGRRVWGRTYCVPLINTSFSSGGLIAAATVGAINSAATALANGFAGNMRVWHRPVFEVGADGKPTDVVKYPGKQIPIVSSTVPTKSVTLNRRRDS